jgi:flagellar FliL protein
MSGAAATQNTATRKGRSKILLLLVVVVLVLGAAGGGGFYFWWKSQQAAQAAQPAEGAPAAGADGHAAPPAPEEPVSGALPFEPFIVNLADQGGTRYLKADVRLVVSGGDVKELEEDQVVMLRLRSAILEHLSQQTSDAIVTPEGKGALKAALAERCSKILGHHAKVTDVLFAEFVVQF